MPQHKGLLELGENHRRGVGTTPGVPEFRVPEIR